MSSGSRRHRNYEPVSPVDPQPRAVAMVESEKPLPAIQLNGRSRSSSSGGSLKSPRAARFAEATAVHSPIEPSKGSSPFADPPGTKVNHYKPQPQPSDFGFGYINNAEPVAVEEDDQPRTQYVNLATPGLKSAMKSPGTPGRYLNGPLSPTFREEQVLEKAEKNTEKEQAKDVKMKFRVRVAKMFLRGVNFSCSLIVLSMLATTFNIVNATKGLPPRNNLPAWAPNGVIWPQITLLVISCVSLAISVIVITAYWRGGHKRAQKTAVYYTVFACGTFVFSIVMWGIAAGVLNHAKQSSNGQDIWGWSCKQNKRQQLFADDVKYALVCRLQNWSLICCIIEVIVEVLAIMVYCIVFFRFTSKQRLRKSMDFRDKARQDLYLAQIRSGTNTPAFPGYAGKNIDDDDDIEEYADAKTQWASPTTTVTPVPVLAAPPKARGGSTPKLGGGGFGNAGGAGGFALAPPPTPRTKAAAAAPAPPNAPTYEAVPIPGAYAPASPGFAPQNFQSMGR